MINKKMLAKGVAYFKRYGVLGFCRRAYRKAVLSRPVNYERWKKQRMASARELDEQRKYPFERKISFGIYMEGTETEKERTIASLQRQSFSNYRILQAADLLGGEEAYLMILQAGVKLCPETLFIFAKTLEDHPEAEFLYGDYEETDAGKTESRFCWTPEFDLYYLQSRNYIGQMFVCSRRLLKKAGLPQAIMQQEGVYAYLLRCASQVEKDADVQHPFGTAMRIPRLLSHQRNLKWEDEKARQCLAQHYIRQGKQVTVGTTPKKGTLISLYQYEEEPLLSVIIPNKDCAGQLEACVTSLLQLGGYENLEILIVENRSREPETFTCYERLRKMDSRVQVVNWDHPFDYAKMNNDAVAQTKGEYLLFLNNDTKVISEGCLKHLMNVGRQEDVGVVGARMYYADGTIQHAGVVLGFGNTAGHGLEGMTKEQYECYPFAFAVRQLSAVTAACMLVKRESFLQTGGFTETLRVAYNDIDLCMKIRKAGWKILYCPQAELFHYESQTRGLEMTSEKAQRLKEEQETFQKRWEKELELGDPFYSPNLTLEKSDFSLERQKIGGCI